jgi:hypothetical protein
VGTGELLENAAGLDACDVGPDFADESESEPPPGGQALGPPPARVGQTPQSSTTWNASVPEPEGTVRSMVNT